ncbi:J domain-containing protein [Heracleum sosnowskyi]|uniref:J domain-containing protein n=1 Tax=Heracleum sosnowskyi TaxID=360622 RepID=A0AAD8HVT0_9APIA|nr:J domain-containing protein [Heracleum sosnowskyi]
MAKSSVTSILKAYSIPIILFTLSLYCQLIIIPRSFPTSHYDVLGIKLDSSIQQVTDAYRDLTAHWNSSAEPLDTSEFIKIQYAYELLTNDLWKRDYDIYGIDEQYHVIDKMKEQYAGAKISDVALPLLEANSFDPLDHNIDVVKSEDFLSKVGTGNQMLIQVFSLGSNRCAKFVDTWKRIVNLLEGIAKTGVVELGDVKLAAYLSEKRSTGRPFFRNGVPSLLASPPGCKASECLVRYSGELSVDAVTDWFATTILGLPRIMYYTKESLVQNFLQKSSRHKVKTIFISKTGERATPFVRQAAKNYWAHVSFAFALWKEEESSFWWNTFGVESAPAIIFLKDPGLDPVVYPGSINNSYFIDIMEQNKYHELPQLRSVTSMELGCDPRGYSRAGNDMMVWYCVVLAGRQSLELNKMRQTMRRVQEKLSNDGDAAPQDELSAAIALKDKRLTFTWLDGEAQNRRCLFYIHSEYSYETCGPRRDLSDVPKLIIVRYSRNDTEDVKIEKDSKNYMAAYLAKDIDPTSQLVAHYNGSDDIGQITQWISTVIKDGDSRNVPFFKTETPELVPEDVDPIWSTGTEKILSSGKGIMQRIISITTGFYDILCDPRCGPFLLLGALMSFGGVWMRRSQATNLNESQTKKKSSTVDNEVRKKRRPHLEPGSKRFKLPSMTDEEPKDAYQVPFSDSDSDE